MADNPVPDSVQAMDNAVGGEATSSVQFDQDAKAREMAKAKYEKQMDAYHKLDVTLVKILQASDTGSYAANSKEYLQALRAGLPGFGPDTLNTDKNAGALQAHLVGLAHTLLYHEDHKIALSPALQQAKDGLTPLESGAVKRIQDVMRSAPPEHSEIITRDMLHAAGEDDPATLVRATRRSHEPFRFENYVLDENNLVNRLVLGFIRPSRPVLNGQTSDSKPAATPQTPPGRGQNHTPAGRPPAPPAGHGHRHAASGRGNSGGTSSQTRRAGTGTHAEPISYTTGDHRTGDTAGNDTRFEKNQAVLSQGDKKALDVMAAEFKTRLKENSELQFQVVGHTDTTGNDKVNMALSQRRAEVAAQYLIKHHGINAKNVVTIGAGSSDLANSNDSTASENRRNTYSFVKPDSPRVQPAVNSGTPPATDLDTGGHVTVASSQGTSIDHSMIVKSNYVRSAPIDSVNLAPASAPTTPSATGAAAWHQRFVDIQDHKVPGLFEEKTADGKGGPVHNAPVPDDVRYDAAKKKWTPRTRTAKARRDTRALNGELRAMAAKPSSPPAIAAATATSPTAGSATKSNLGVNPQVVKPRKYNMMEHS